MTRRPPRSTRTDTLFPYTTLFRSAGEWLIAWVRDWAGEGFWVGVLQWLVDIAAIGAIAVASFFLFPAVMVTIMALLLDDIARAVERRHYPDLPPARSQPLGEAVFGNVLFRSEERRVGKEGVRTGRSRWAPCH